MADQAYILNRNELDTLIIQLRQQMTREISAFRGLVVEKPMTTKEAANFLSVHPKTLIRKMGAGNIPFHKDGKMCYFFPSELSEYLKSKNKKK